MHTRRPGTRLTLVVVRVLAAVRRPRESGPALAIAVSLAASVAAQRGRRGFGGGRFQTRIGPNAPYDGTFRFCRIMFRQNPNGDGDGWSVDYPRADINLSYRLSELTSTSVGRDGQGGYNHAVF